MNAQHQIDALKKALLTGSRGTNYAWVITRDHLNEEEPSDLFPSEVGKMGPRGAIVSKEFVLENGTEFLMGDDDGNLYYTGLIVGVGLFDDVDGFEPLDDFGAPASGCTWIKYRNDATGDWEVL